MANVVFNRTVEKIALGTLDFVNDTIVLVPLEGTHSVTKDDDHVFGTLLGAGLTEYTGTGYNGGHGGAGRIALTTKAINRNDTSDEIEFTCDSPVGGSGTDWSDLDGTTITAIAMVKPGTTNDTDAICWAVFDIADVAANASPFSVTIPSTGILKLSNA